MPRRSLTILIVLLAFVTLAAGCFPAVTPPAAAPLAAATIPPATAVPAQVAPTPVPMTAPTPTPVADAKPKALALLAPDPAQPIAAPVEVRWEALDGAAAYRVTVVDMGTSELLFQQDVPATSVTVDQPFKPGHGYSISVGGLNAAGEQIAFYSGEFTAAGTPVAPEDEPVQSVPAVCYREGLLTYVNRDLGLCFAYPGGYAFAGPDGPYAAGSQAKAELRGPATGSGPEPHFARLSLDFQPYQGIDLAPFVDELIKRDVPADLAATVKRTQTTWGGHGAEVLEPWPGQLSSRLVVVDNTPAGYHLLYFWPSFADAGAGKVGADAQQAQKDIEALYKTVSETFATLPPPGVPIDPAARIDLRTSKPYQGVSFSYPASLAQDTAGETVPAAGGSDSPAWAVAPEHVEIGLVGYALPESTQAPRIAVYPADGYASLSPQAAAQIASLKTLLAAKPAPPEGALPSLPLANAVQQLHVLPAYLPFKGGEGVRYLAQYGQGPAPVNNADLFYTFQGLTADGRYYVSAILPVSHPALPATAAAVPAAQMDALAAGYKGYLNEVAATLATAPGASFKPALGDLDTLVQSIEIVPAER